MIVIKLLGGLGNQMFQYAMGRHLSLKLNTDLKLDISEFENDTLRQYYLSPFCINEHFATKEELKNFMPGYLNWFFKKPTKLIREKSFTFDPKILSLNGNLMLKGYWQSYRYFEDIPEAIKKDFSLKKPFSKSYKVLLDEINYVNSIGVHIRRGDYVCDMITNEYHGVCSPEYYLNAAKYIAEKIIDPRFYIFSDDPQWIKTNFSIPFKFKNVIELEGQSSHQDMVLMSKCRHNITANSTFSWWAAWLNQNPDKIIIAPQKWFAGAKNKTDDLVPKDWIRL